MADVLFLTLDDWSNTGWRYCQCLRLLGLDAQMFKGRPHRFDYPDQAPMHPGIHEGRVVARYPVLVKTLNEDLRGRMEAARSLHFVGETWIDCEADIRCPVVVDKGGSTMRQAPELVNRFFNPRVTATIILCPDLLGLGSYNEHLIYYPVDTEVLRPNFDPAGEKLRIGHWPSTARTKGTRSILEVIRELEQTPWFADRFEYIGLGEERDNGRLSWVEHIDRVRTCDVLIETLAEKQGNKMFGAWGNQAIEAAALGKIVVTNDLYQEVYAREYGDCALEVANTPDELDGRLRDILSWSPERVRAKKMATRAWVDEKHGMAPTAKRLWDRVYKDIL